MFRINYLKALLFPLRSPRRFVQFLAVGWLLQIFAGLGLLLDFGLVLAPMGIITVAPQAVSHGAARLLCFSMLSGVLGLLLTFFFMVLMSMLFFGYFLRSIREVAQGASSIPGWQHWPSLLGDSIRLVVAQLPIVIPFVVAFLLGELKSAHSALRWAIGWSTTLGDLYGPLFLVIGGGLALALLTIASLLLGFIGNMLFLRLAVDRSVWSVWNVVGIWRDIRRGWLDYLLIYLVLLIPAFGMQLALLFLGINPLLLPILYVPVMAVVVQPLACYAWLVAANLLGQYHRAYRAR